MTERDRPKAYDPHGELDLENRRRRLLFRAWHRGIKEMDLIFGNFIQSRMESLSHEDCAWFERLFEENDHQVMNWVTSKEDPPQAYAGPMMDALRQLDFMTLKAR
ncbi:FAD assembly factor SdhE [Yunchengibacter salinarum]|uniref:FAD assembly factor SdhE n=1 Tax=Yunchengibacter salinarum TaxID=3133399 RepID=UPI0035B59097